MWSKTNLLILTEYITYYIYMRNTPGRPYASPIGSPNLDTCGPPDLVRASWPRWPSHGRRTAGASPRTARSAGASFGGCWKILWQKMRKSIKQ